MNDLKRIYLSRRDLLVGACALAVTGVPLAGCGGGRSVSVPLGLTGKMGRGTFRVAWPSRAKTRLVPVAANSIKVDVIYKGNPFQSVTINRPPDGSPSSATFDVLPLGEVVVTATAYPEQDAQGVALATGTAPFVVKGGGANNTLSLTMLSTITEIYPFCDVWRLPVGGTTTFTAYAFDADGNFVLTTDSKLEWKSDNAAVSIDLKSGVATGNGVGDATITVTDKESGISGTTDLGARYPGIEVWPDTVTVAINSVNPEAFFALDIITGDVVDASWAVLGIGGGSIDADGTYHAPASTGNFTVQATNKANTAQKATAAVNVSTNANLLPVGTVAPAINGTTIDGSAFHLSDYAGKVVLVDFCATWCPPCQDEVPTLIDLQNTYGANGFTVVSLFVDADTSAVAPYVASNSINYPVLLATSRMVNDYGGISLIPTTYLVDKTGKIAFSVIGETTEDAFKAQITPLL